MKSNLLSPLKVGDLTLRNRIFMAPLTRQRTAEDRVPNDMMVEYYRQRSTAGLILTEATCIEPMGVGYEFTPGIWNQPQIAGWQKVTQAVHQEGGKIFLQLWHVGRISDPSLLNGELPVSPSAIQAKGEVKRLRPKRPYPTPRELETKEVKNLVETYRKAAVNAKEAGFDGVEIHAANGYLIDQFIQSTTNQRTDEYGGAVENRARFLLEITDALIEVYGSGRVGVHLAPAMDSHDMGDANPKETFGYIAKELGKKNIAFIFTREGQSDQSLTPYIKEQFGGVVVANQDLSLKKAEELIETKKADAVSWGRYFISNPDLVLRIEKGVAFNEFDPDSFYESGPKGYIDYPFMDE